MLCKNVTGLETFLQEDNPTILLYFKSGNSWFMQKTKGCDSPNYLHSLRKQGQHLHLSHSLLFLLSSYSPPGKTLLTFYIR